MFKHLTLKSLKDFFKVRDENNNYDREQVKATAIQTGMMLFSFAVIILLLYYTGVLEWILS